MSTKIVTTLSGEPPQTAWFDGIARLYDRCRPDQVLVSISNGALVNPKDYVPAHHRKAMARVMAREYLDITVRMTDIEDRLDLRDPYSALREIQGLYPEDRLIFAIEAESLMNAGEEVVRRILSDFSVVATGHDSRVQALLCASFAQDFQSHRVENLSDLMTRARPGWSVFAHSGNEATSPRVRWRRRGDGQSCRDLSQGVESFRIQ